MATGADREETAAGTTAARERRRRPGPIPLLVILVGVGAVAAGVIAHAGDDRALSRARYLAAADGTCLRYEDRRPPEPRTTDRAGARAHLAALAGSNHRFFDEWSALRPPDGLRAGHARLRGIWEAWEVTVDAARTRLDRGGDASAAIAEVHAARSATADRFARTARSMGLRDCGGRHDGPRDAAV